MSDPKNNESFLRKVVRFVANPTTDWAELSTSTAGRANVSKTPA